LGGLLAHGRRVVATGDLAEVPGRWVWVLTGNGCRGASEAKAHPAALLDPMAAGEEIAIMRHGESVARLVPAGHGGSALTGGSVNFWVLDGRFADER
jgi:antitoxin (DNA-binding transcriptional repressor) of toxin-antitoxin stability system